MTNPHAALFDLLDPAQNRIYNMPVEEARALVRSGDPAAVRGIDGSFALVAKDGDTVRLARTIDRPIRFFLAKRVEGPALFVAERIDQLHAALVRAGLGDQFQPTYSRMVPAHHVLEVSLRGCPDPFPVAKRFFEPARETLPADVSVIAERYVGRAYQEIVKWVKSVPEREPLGVCFSGGVDSGAVLLFLHHALGELNIPRQRLKAFTLAVDGGGADLAQARSFLDQVGLGIYGETIEARADSLSLERTLAVLEDYKPLDVHCGAALLALLEGIRARYPKWIHLADGDGGDENLKDYPIEENPELTIRSVLNNSMLYQEGWGVGSLKHSLTYSGGQSRSYVRTWAPARALGFAGFSPFTLPAVIEVSEAIPFIELTQWSVPALYALKGQIVGRGVKALTGIDMPLFEKRRFQDGVVPEKRFPSAFTGNELAYRRSFHAKYQ